ncbi:hypothetical protein NDU88_002780 [Pleurodeles waltl]|uniref:Uncharacterized protein n=1 Tax=Pleurodeles waltl TaxID=8319 RepID=A0AAV7UAP9_PLEWA|nr:hypothetical protein NDU88_002780 [Pleurodeles waltl]
MHIADRPQVCGHDLLNSALLHRQHHDILAYCLADLQQYRPAELTLRVPSLPDDYQLQAAQCTCRLAPLWMTATPAANLTHVVALKPDRAMQRRTSTAL